LADLSPDHSRYVRKRSVDTAEAALRISNNTSSASVAPRHGRKKSYA
jgi:hypothetical protein